MAPISFKKFIQVIHTAILLSSEQIAEKNVNLLNKYFEERESKLLDENGIEITRKSWVPKMVTLIYPQRIQTENNANPTNFISFQEPVEVPLISLVPMEMCGIKKATFTTEFEMEVKQDELQIYFGKPDTSLFKKNVKTNHGKLEITLTPQETTEGLRIITEGYENFLKRQIT